MYNTTVCARFVCKAVVQTTEPEVVQAAQATDPEVVQVIIQAVNRAIVQVIVHAVVRAATVMIETG